ncbi:MAG: 50S ribosomal protein L18 [uncultured bacterium]|nr:MAG: 50S ribosomal protein L18 [uncultured bacterium]OGJ47977.1 MAG: 50S ribosomal protein L18 [Candidatus Peregrinibacteria bacterium RIFOXYB12_FULL_41_12]OGJ48479.1 MAG: 50S ribosomal protein L18 [Candidatus Peregrinibacteria bacterium RIFOXYA2_FULL_41_18]OGJ52507.1 MAG: 50S ribosomal protein L18 [Candidatus Peregrinibacteria bacterium RIFOXYC2_FULL_41_22]OGJ55368.1 MAG: 50S ribosomal protein L18 [Candidatus Peregrinibacteria bacterium RIFOXYB2_FULL_41_88]
MKNSKAEQKNRRHARVLKKIKGTKPRLLVFRSAIANYAQLIDDTAGKIICSASDLKIKKGKKMEKAKEVGMELAKKAIEKGITECVFDRNGYRYHGRVKAIADGAREAGLKF